MYVYMCVYLESVRNTRDVLSVFFSFILKYCICQSLREMRGEKNYMPCGKTKTKQQQQKTTGKVFKFM